MGPNLRRSTLHFPFGPVKPPWGTPIWAFPGDPPGEIGGKGGLARVPNRMPGVCHGASAWGTMGLAWWHLHASIRHASSRSSISGDHNDAGASMSDHRGPAMAPKPPAHAAPTEPAKPISHSSWIWRKTHLPVGTHRQQG